MQLSLTGITQNDLDYAIECLENCKHENAKAFGFNYPYFAPGGAYGDQWWQLDSSLALCGYKWYDRKFTETSLRNFIESQKDDGRICLWGADTLPSAVAGGDFPIQVDGVSSLPKIFDVAYHILQGTNNCELLKDTYYMMKKYIDWWFFNRLDKKSGLITAVFEETFIPYLGKSGEYAPVDTNTEVYAGCHYTQLLAEKLGIISDSVDLLTRKHNLKQSINKYLWNEEKGAYYSYDVKEEKIIDRLTATTFYPLRLCIADKHQQKKLIALIKNDKHFNWNTIPLTSVSKLDKCFTTTKGEYCGNASWSGNVWTLINEMVIRGLVDCKENELAAELALKTIYAFNHNCSEFINPFDGSGHGVLKYAWTASQYIELIIEVIFGISYNASKNEVTLAPRLTPKLKESYMAIENIELEPNKYLSVIIDRGKISYKSSDTSLKIIIN